MLIHGCLEPLEGLPSGAVVGEDDDPADPIPALARWVGRELPAGKEYWCVAVWLAELPGTLIIGRLDQYLPDIFCACPDGRSRPI